MLSIIPGLHLLDAPPVFLQADVVMRHPIFELLNLDRLLMENPNSYAPAPLPQYLYLAFKE